MRRRLFPVCLTLALWGCNASTPPAPVGGTAATSGGSASTREVALDTAGGADSDAVAADETESGTDSSGKAGGDVTADETTGRTDPDGEPKSAKSGDEPKKPEAGGVEAAMRKLRRARTPEMLKSGAEALEKALDDDPDNRDGQRMMLTALQLQIEDAEENDQPTGPLWHKLVAFLGSASKAEPELLEDVDFNRFYANACYQDARGLAREKKLPEALASLGKAIDFGYMRIDEIQKNKDLAQVRELPEFSAFIAAAEKKIAEANEKIRIAAEKEVAQLLEENEPFEFDFDLEDVAGKKLSKADLAGKVLIVDIWGTWCQPCRMEIPHFVNLDKEYREKGLQIVGLSQEDGEDDEKIETIKEFCEANGVTYPCAPLTEEIMKQVPDFEGFPTTLFLDRTGKVRMKAVGYKEIHFLRATVEALLKEKGAAPADQPAEQTSE